MHLIKKIIQHSLGGIIGALAAAFVGFFFFTGQVKTLEHLSYDLPYALRTPVRPDSVLIVYIDEDSDTRLGQTGNLIWNRADTHGRLLDRLTEEGAAAAVFDVVFDTPSPDPQIDERFAQSLEQFGKAVLAANEAPTGLGQNQLGQKITPPLDVFLNGAASIGVPTLPADDDFIVRRHPKVFADAFVHPLAWAAAEFLRAIGTSNPTEIESARWIDYYGPPATIPWISYWQAFDLQETPPGFFRDKVVFIGSRTLTKTAWERKDSYSSPHSRWISAHDSSDRHLSTAIPGVEIHASIFANLARNEWLSRIPATQELSFVLALGVLFGIGLAQLRPFMAALAAAIGIAVVAVLAYVLVTKTQFWIAWMILVVEIAVACGWSVLFNSIKLHVQKRLMQHSLAMYVSPAQVKQIYKHQEMLKPGAVKQELSILFSDIANFTAMSEGMDPDELANLMNNYFEMAVGNCVHPTQGTVVKFIGDAIFAIWNAPEEQPGHPERACRAALLLRDESARFAAERIKRPDLNVRTRVGLHCGVANVGNFGSSTRIDYTAFGENINMAARMESLNKYLGTDLLITGDIEKHVRDRFVTRHLGQFVLKGFEKQVEVYELKALPEHAEASRPYREAFAKALKHFKRRNWEAAAAGMREVIELHPADGPAQFYLQQIEYLEQNPPSEEWNGEIHLKEK